MALPGVKIGPLDPDATSEFGKVAAENSARTLLRLHARAHPAELTRELARKTDAERTKGLDLDEVRTYLGELRLENGDPMVPENAEVVAAAVHGDRDTKQVLTFTYVMPSGRTGKWFAPYSRADLPESVSSGDELVKVFEMKERGIVQYDAEGATTEVQRREIAALKAENEKLRRSIAGEPADDDEDESLEGGGEEPVEGYDNLNAEGARKLLRDESTSEETREAILAYERSHANRRSVTGAADQSLGTT